MSFMEHKRFRMPVRWRFLIVFVLFVVALWQHQSIHDWLLLRSYQPPAAVVQLADDIKLSPPARRIFYVNHPSLDDRQSFGSFCGGRGEHTIVLGCYHPVDRGIFVFHVTDYRLNGVDQVTAAHEMLHAAYDRLSGSKRIRIDGLLQNYFEHDVHDDRLKTIIAAYRKSEPQDIVNEMHSIFGTEVANLPPALETYYKQYFEDRSKIVGYASDYQQEFTSRQQQVAAYDQQLQDMKQQISNNTTSLDTREQEITALRSQMDAERSSGNVDGYNANVSNYNSRIDAYNGLINRTKTLIASYNNIVVARNELALQVADLAHSIDSSFQPISQ